jgi:hypothetical protein
VGQERTHFVEPAIYPEPREPHLQLAGQGRERELIHGHGRSVDDVDDIRVEVALRGHEAITAADGIEVVSASVATDGAARAFTPTRSPRRAW